MAPEILRGDAADYRSDLWALGVVLYESASGCLPFEGRTGFEISSAIMREIPKPLGPPVPPGLWGIIQRCMAKEPAQRYQRAGEVQAALEAVQSGVIVSPAADVAHHDDGPAQFAACSGPKRRFSSVGGHDKRSIHPSLQRATHSLGYRRHLIPRSIGRKNLCLVSSLRHLLRKLLAVAEHYGR